MDIIILFVVFIVSVLVWLYSILAVLITGIVFLIQGTRRKERKKKVFSLVCFGVFLLIGPLSIWLVYLEFA